MILFYNRFGTYWCCEPYTWTLGSLIPFIEKYEHALWRNRYTKICYSNMKSLQLETSSLGSKNNVIFNGLIAKSLDFCILIYSFSFLLLNWTHFLFTVKLCPCSASILQLWSFVSIFAKNSESVFSFVHHHTLQPNLANPHDHTTYVGFKQKYRKNCLQK